MKNCSSTALRVFAASLLCSAAAFAQDPPPPLPPATTPATTPTGPATTTPSTTMAPPTQPAASASTSMSVSTSKPAETTAEPVGTSDHDQMVGRLAVGYLGTTSVPIASGGAGGNVGTDSISAPVVGVRYWINTRIGIDGGLGIGWTGGSSEVVTPASTVTNTSASRFGGVLHAGVPVALVSAKHYTFQVVPELNVGYATSTLAAQNLPAGAQVPPDIKLTGFRFDVGARAGAEVHFGFIGVPQLALQGTVGVNFATESRTFKQDNNSASASSTKFGTSVNASPWAIFTNNISALYYF